MLPVSVIIPTYNRANYLLRAINSVLTQHLFNGEIIVVDDGSTDNTQEIVANVSKENTLEYIHIRNSGPAAARNRGVEVAKHQLIAFLDSDDHWCKNKLKKQIAFLTENSKFSICHTEEKWLRRGVHLNQKNIHKPKHGYIFNHNLQLCAVGMSTVVMEKNLFWQFGGFDEKLRCCEDYDFWLRLSSKKQFLLLPEPLTIKEGGRVDQLSYKYRIGMDKYRIYALEKLLQNFGLTREQHNDALSELRKKCNVYGNGCIKYGRTEEGALYLGIPDKYKWV